MKEGIPPTYEILTVGDFLKVPEDRIGACLKEFAVAIELWRNGLGLLGAIADDVVPSDQEKPRWEPGAFTWIDDNKRTATLKVMAPE